MIVLGLIAIPILIAINGLSWPSSSRSWPFARLALRKCSVRAFAALAPSRSRRAARIAASRPPSSASRSPALRLGAVGESVLAVLMGASARLYPEHLQLVTRHSIAALASVFVITYLHVILGEQVPRDDGNQSTEKISSAVKPLNLFARVTSPVLRS